MSTRITHTRVGEHAACDIYVEANLVEDRPTCKRCIRLMMAESRRLNRDGLPFGTELEQALLAVGDDAVDEDEYFVLRDDDGLSARGTARLLGRQVREVLQ